VASSTGNDLSIQVGYWCGYLVALLQQLQWRQMHANGCKIVGVLLLGFCPILHACFCWGFKSFNQWLNNSAA
jgi:hypothetical protein